MEKMDFYVYLSPKEAAEKVKEAVTAGLYSGEILDEYVRILPDGKEIIMVLFEKYYMRSGNRATLTFWRIIWRSTQGCIFLPAAAVKG